MLLKQQIISSGLALADFVHRYPRHVTAGIAGLLLAGGSGAFAVASLAPAIPTEPLRLVTESIATAYPLLPQHADLAVLDLYRTEQIRATDSPESLLERLGIADPVASAFIRRDKTAWGSMFGSGAPATPEVTAVADGEHNLLRMRMRWLDRSGDEPQAKMLLIERTAEGFSAQVQTVPVVVTQRLATGSVESSLYATAAEADLPRAVARQLMTMFDEHIDVQRGLHSGDHYTVVYEQFESDGELLGTGRVLSAEFSHQGETYRALWFEDGQSSRGDYYSFEGSSLTRTAFINPLSRMRLTSRFGMRVNPVTGMRLGHAGTDYAAPRGAPVSVVADGVVRFAGVQHGYGKVVYVRHGKGKYETVYGHLSRIDVKVGQQLKQGAQLGLVGSTGIATGPHLHFEFRDADGQPHDSAKALRERREEARTVSPKDSAAFALLTRSMARELSLANGLKVDSAPFE